MKYKYVAEPLYEGCHERDGVESADPRKDGCECTCEWCGRYPAATPVYYVKTNLRLRKPELHCATVTWVTPGFLHYDAEGVEKILCAHEVGLSPEEAVEKYVTAKRKDIEREREVIERSERYIATLAGWISETKEIVNEPTSFSVSANFVSDTCEA